MKLISAEFENFRLLRDLRLDFATEETLTVIRAENETGKTTILTGLQWALYGDDALPDKGRDYRLHPIDWNVEEGARVSISAQVDFETLSVRKSRNGMIERIQRYRIIRTASETLKGTEWDRTASSVKLFRLSAHGSEPIEPPEAVIDEELPKELREVFFTDGDRALSFIEATVSVATKRERVQRAIRSLLGLGVIEDSLKHVKKASAQSNKAAKSLGTDKKLSQIASDLEAVDKEATELEEKITDAKAQFAAFDEKLGEVQKRIDAALVKGDREALKNDIHQVEQQLEKLDSQRLEAAKDHSKLYRGIALARDLMAATLESGLNRLGELHDQGKIPNTTIPVLEERLSSKYCICGEALDPSEENGRRRREHIQGLIDESRKADELQGVITDLYYGSRSLELDSTEQTKWIAEFGKVAKRRDDLEITRNDIGKKRKALEAQLEAIPDTDIKGLRETRKNYSDQRDRFHSAFTRYQTKLDGLKKERERLAVQRDNMLREQRKGVRILSDLEVTQDIERVLRNSYERITEQELAKVSDLMNGIFLEMIGSDPEQGAIIRKAEISKDFDILVYGPGGRTLNPDRDLNGASRRALTLAFILALTKVSEVEAPNVIDTPLGMMSGFVKQSVLKAAIRESSQLVLFLTRAEISDCEDILDTQAGQVITLTNPAHYPIMLVNDPRTAARTVLRCECDHRSECQLCERRAAPDEMANS